MGILSGNPKDEPMHYGEVFDIWGFSMKAKLSLSCYQAYRNHAGDKDLKKVLSELIDQAKLEIKECDAYIIEHGLAPAPELPERPEVKTVDIPVGARFSDQEIAAHIAADTAIGLTACSSVMGMSIREDIGALFAKYHTTKAAYSLQILRMNKEKGWLVPPPLHKPTQEPVHV